MASSLLSQYDFILRDGDREYGYVLSWTPDSDSSWTLVMEEESALPKNVTSDEDENYGFRDLQDAWRLSFSNFSGGEGQLHRDISGGSPAKYYRGQRVNTDVEGDVSLHHALTKIAHTGTGTITDRLKNVVCEYKGMVCFLLDPISTQTQVRQTDYVRGQVGCYDDGTFTSTGLKDTGSYARTAPPICMTTDGQYLYVAYSGSSDNGGGIWRHEWTGSTWADAVLYNSTATATGVLAMSYCAGYLYCATANTVYTAPETSALVALSASGVITPNLTTFGLAEMDNYVYWGVTSGARSWVYAVQRNGSPPFALYASLPTGFVGTTIAGYVNSLYVCGYNLSPESDTYQGKVYLVTDAGMSMLCTIGEDPAFATTIDDNLKNQIYAAYGYDRFIYLLTARDLYRWDIKRGGLNHVAATGAYAATSSQSGETIFNDWIKTKGVWNDGTYTNPFFTAGVMSSAGHRGTDHAIDYTEATTIGMLIKSTTGDRSGHAQAVGLEWHNDTDLDLTEGATLEIEAGAFRRWCLEFGIYVPYRSRAIFKIYAREVEDEFKIHWQDKTGKDCSSGWLQGRLAMHLFHLSVTATTATLVMDGTEIVKDLELPGYDADGQIFVNAGSWYWMPPDYQDPDWRVKLKGIRFCEGSIDSSYIQGTVGSCSFTVLNSMPYIPSVVEGGENYLVTIDPTSYPIDDPTSLLPEEHLYGFLETSVSASRMPTIEKSLLYLDVLHEPLNTNEKIVIYYYPDSGSTIPSGQCQILPDEGPLTERPRLTSFLLRGTAYELWARVELHTSDGLTSPVVHGLSFRFAPPASYFYQLRVDLREEKGDYGGSRIPHQQARDFLLAAAAEKRIVEMENQLETCNVKIVGLQMAGQPRQQQHSYEPQGIVIIKLRKTT